MFQRSRTPLAELQPGRIAVIKPSALGDVVHSMPLVNALRARYPEAAITWVINKGYVALVDGHPAINGHIPFDRGSMKKGWKQAAKESGKFVAELRRGRFDLVFDLQCLARTGLMCIASGALKQIFVEVMPAVIAKKGGDPMQIFDELAAFRVGWTDGAPLTRELWQRRLDEWREVIADGHSPWLDLHGVAKKEAGE